MDKYFVNSLLLREMLNDLIIYILIKFITRIIFNIPLLFYNIKLYMHINIYFFNHLYQRLSKIEKSLTIKTNNLLPEKSFSSYLNSNSIFI